MFKKSSSCIVGEVCNFALLKSAFYTLEFVDLSLNLILDETLEKFLKILNLHTLICSYVDGLSGTAFACEKVSALIRVPDFAGSRELTREGFRRIFDLSSIEHLFLDRLGYKSILALTDFIKYDFESSKLARSLKLISFEFSRILQGELLGI